MMRRIPVNPGDKYGDLVVVRELESSGKRKFLCRCSCGNTAEVRLGHLRSGHTQTCGRCGLELNGVRKTLKEWAESHGLKESTLRARLKTMSLEEALRRGRT